MSGFLYYLPQHRGNASSASLRAMGLAYAFDGTGAFVETRRGPDGNSGVMVCDTPRVSAADLGYYPDRQEWRQIPGNMVWVGMTTDNRPAPNGLERRRMLDGRPVTLGDGNEWVVPVARAFTSTTEGFGWYVALPQALTLGTDGKWTAGEVQPAYRRLWDASQAFADHLHLSLAKALDDDAGTDGDPIVLDIQGECDAAVVALQTNYHVAAVELDMLGAFSEETVEQVLLTLVDWDGFQACSKKNLAKPSTGPGEADLCATTHQPLAS